MIHLQDGDVVLVLVLLFLGCQVVYWLMLQVSALLLVVVASRALVLYCNGG